MLTGISYVLTFFVGMGIGAIAPAPNADNNAVGNYVTHGIGQPDCSNVASDFRLAGCNGIPLGAPFVTDQKHDKGDVESEHGPAS